MPLTELTAAEKIENARIMYGTWSPQHKRALERFGAARAAEAAVTK